MSDRITRKRKTVCALIVLATIAGVLTSLACFQAPQHTSTKAQYYLTVNTDPAVAGAASPLSGWQDANATITLSATPIVGYKFYAWIGTGAGSYTGSSSTATITMNGPITETAVFSTVFNYLAPHAPD